MPPPSASPPPDDLERRIRQDALELGFARVGFAPVERFGEAAVRLRAWLDAGYGAAMAYLAEVDDRADPAALLEGARTIISVALAHCPPLHLRRSREGPALAGEVAAYAVGTDYHLVLKGKLAALAERVSELAGRPVPSRICVDTAPLLEREAARRAGLGFTGKNTLTIAPGLGSRFLLGELLVDIEVGGSEPVLQGCGRCTACLDACPTGAFVGPYVLDARRCISYLTIETKAPIPRELRSKIGTRVFGCDVCQDACPFNASAAERPVPPELLPRAGLDPADLVQLLNLGSAGYRKLVKRSALRRVGKTEIRRNAAVALGNTKDARAVGPLALALETEKSPLVRTHIAWALGELRELGGAAAHEALERAARDDVDAAVREEATAALERRSPERASERVGR